LKHLAPLEFLDFRIFSGGEFKILAIDPTFFPGFQPSTVKITLFFP